MLVAIIAFIFTGCKKDSSSSTPAASDANQANIAQDAETQDAISTQVESSADNQADQLENNNFSSSFAVVSYRVAKSDTLSLSGVTITIDHPDTTYFPKVITFTFNVNDTVNGVIMSQTGSIQLVVSVDTTLVNWQKQWRKHVSRVFTFNNFTVGIDSNKFSISGTRTMDRVNWLGTVTPNSTRQLLRVVVQDNITSALNITVASGKTSIGTFTRNVDRTRVSDLHYWKNTNNIGWHSVGSILEDSVTFTGSVTGNNLQNLPYSRVITSPLIFSFCSTFPYTPILNGVIKDTEDGANGTSVVTITYTAVDCTTNVVAVDSNGKTVKIGHTINHLFKKWW